MAGSWHSAHTDSLLLPVELGILRLPRIFHHCHLSHPQSSVRFFRVLLLAVISDQLFEGVAKGNAMLLIRENCVLWDSRSTYSRLFNDQEHTTGTTQCKQRMRQNLQEVYDLVTKPTRSIFSIWSLIVLSASSRASWGRRFPRRSFNSIKKSQIQKIGRYSLRIPSSQFLDW